MSEREAFLQAIATNPGDTLVHLVFADWLDERGEHEEAERQRKWPEAIEWLQNICNVINAGCQKGEEFTCDRLIRFGQFVSANTSTNVEVSIDIPDGHIIAAIQDRIPEFWKSWSIVTGLPLEPDIEQKCYYHSGYCCNNEIYPDTHVAGPKSAEFIRAEEELARVERVLELEEAEAQRRLDDEAAGRRQRELEMIQDELERDRP